MLSDCSVYPGAPIFGPRLLWPNGIKMLLGTEVGVGLHDIVSDGDQAHPSLEGHSPHFSAIVRCGQTAGWTKMPLGMEVGLGPGDFVFDGDPATRRKRAHSPPPNFWPMSIVAKRLDGWSLGTEIDLGAGHIVLDVVPAICEWGTAAPLFSSMYVVATVAHLGYCWALVSSSYTARLGVHKRQIKLGYLEHKADVTQAAFQRQKLAPVDQHL